MDFEKFMNSYSNRNYLQGNRRTLIYMELHTADKHVHLVTINTLICNEERKSIFLSVTVYVLPFRFYLAKLNSYSLFMLQLCVSNTVGEGLFIFKTPPVRLD